MHAQFQFEGLCAVIQLDLNKVEKSEKQDGVFLQIIAVFQCCSNLPSFVAHLASHPWGWMNSGVQIQ